MSRYSQWTCRICKKTLYDIDTHEMVDHVLMHIEMIIGAMNRK